MRHAPLVHEKNLAMGREERPASPGEEIGRARAEESVTDTTGMITPMRESRSSSKGGTRGDREARQRDPKSRALERSGNQTSCRPDAPTRRREIEEAVEGKHSPIRHGTRCTRLGEVQPYRTEVGALRVPTDIHHSYPQSGLVEVTTRADE